MKRYYPYTIMWLFCLAFLVTSCEKQEPDFYDKNENGVYFDYNTNEEFQQSINFADHGLGNPQELTVNVNIKLLGYMLEGNRKAILKTKTVENYPEASVTIPEVVFTSEESEKVLLGIFKDVKENEDNSFGNARGVRNLFEKTLVNQANRIAKNGCVGSETQILLPEDFEDGRPKKIKKVDAMA